MDIRGTVIKFLFHYSSMELNERYHKQKAILLDSVNESNHKIMSEFFKHMEHKLKRINGLSALDLGAYRTLYLYVMRFKNVDKWFKGKAWDQLTKKDIQKVYDDLEDGKIKTSKGKPFKERDDYYSKVFKSKPFEIAGVSEIAKEVIQYCKPNNNEVRFVEEAEFLKLVEHAYKPQHKLLMWLAWDYGENINAILQLTKKDFTRQINEYTKQPEYLLNFRREILKRSRTARGEINIHEMTVLLLDSYLDKLKDKELLFPFAYKNAAQILDNAIKHSGATCSPAQDKPTWKDFRSGMACYLLRTGWSRDEVNARLGHKPSSVEIDKYINFLALDKNKPKVKKHHSDITKLQEEVEQLKRRNRMNSEKIEELSGVYDLLRGYLASKTKVSEEDVQLLKAINTAKKP